MVLIGGDQSIYVYEIGTSGLVCLGEIQTSGNQKITCFIITENLRVIAGTSSGELILADLEPELGKETYFFHWKNHLVLQSAPFRMSYDPVIPNVAICLADGTVMAVNPHTGKSLSEKHTMDVEPLSAACFQIISGKFCCFLAFGMKVHCVEIETREPEIEIAEELPPPEPPEPPPVIVRQEEITPEAALVDEFNESLRRLSQLLEFTKLQRKRKQFIPEAAAVESDEVVAQSAPIKPKPPYSEVMARNADRIEEETLDFKRLERSPKRPSSRNPAVKTHETDEESALVVTPFFYTDLPSQSRVMIPSRSASQSRASSVALSETQMTEKKSFIVAVRTGPKSILQAKVQ
jgi:hypothetical protein